LEQALHSDNIHEVNRPSADTNNIDTPSRVAAEDLAMYGTLFKVAATSKTHPY